MRKTKLLVLTAFLFTFFCDINAQLRDGLVAHWPLDAISGETTPDVVNGYDMELTNLDDSNVVGGKVGNAFSFSNSDQTLLKRAHEEGEDLPINQHDSFTISFWAKVQGNGQNDLRVFSESNVDGNNTPLFNLGTKNDGSNGTVDIYIRGIGPTVGHIFTDAEPFDDEWSHVVFVQDNLERKMYIDGEPDGLEIGAKPEGDWALNATSIGGIIRGNASHWVTGLIDEVALWKRALSESEVSELYVNGVPAENTLGIDLLGYWPMDEGSGDVAADSTGNNNAQLYNEVEWENDGERGSVLSFNGVDAYADAGSETIPQLTQDSDFTWSIWSYDRGGSNNNVVFGNRYGPEGSDFSPREFIKFTPNQFEFHYGGGGGGNVDYDDYVPDDGWIHHVAVKAGNVITYYRNGEAEGSREFEGELNNPQPLYFGGDKQNENWNGLLDDAAIWGRALSAEEVNDVFNGASLMGGVIIPKPSLKLVGTMSGFSIELTDNDDGSTVDPSGLFVTFDGTSLEVNASKSDSVTTFNYETPELLTAGTEHTVQIVINDVEGGKHVLDKVFKVKAYTVVDVGSKASESLKGEQGIAAYITQISQGQGVGDLHGNQIVNAEKAFNGWGIDTNTEEPFLNEADPDSFEGWSYFPVLVDVVNMNQDAPGNAGNFNSNNGYEDQEIPNIPGWGDSTDGIAGEFTALLELKKGSYKFGVNSDDGFKATIGANFTDMLAQQIGSFNGGRGAADTTFTIYVPEDGLYPYRVLWFEGGGGANVELFSFVDGEKVLINDPDVEGSIKAYSLKGITFDESSTERADTGRAAVISMSPANGDKLVKASSISLMIKNGSATTVDQSSASISLNGDKVDANVSKDGGNVIISYSSEGGLPVGAHTVDVSFNESNGIERNATWSFAVPGVYQLAGEVPSEAEGFISVREYHGIGGTALSAIFADADFPDNPNVNTVATYFEWPQSGDIDVLPPGNVRDNYAWHAMGFVYPPETGEYRFFAATDDNSQLWLSTDADPANAVQITQESQWRGIRAYGDEDESNSGPVFLEKGKPYFIEIFTNEGGGGDNMAVAWSLPSDEGEAPANGSRPISGEYLSPFVSVIDPEPTPLLTGNSPKGAFAIGEGGDIEVTFLNRGLDLVDVSVTVNGAEVASKVNVDGKVSTITASPGDVKGTVEVAVSYNGETLEWSYLTYEPLDPDGPNPVAFWNFDGTTEDWAFGAMGELRNGAVFTDDSYEGQALDLTDGGNQHMHVANASALNIAASIDEVTITFWQKLNSTPNTSSFWAFSPTASSGGRAMQAHSPWSNGNIYWDTAGCCDGGTQRINADATDNQVWEEWNHYAFVKSGSYKAIYVNGELFHDGDNTSPLPTDITYLNVGGDQNGNNSVRGAIDDFAIFAATLDEDQIYAIYEGDRSLYPKEPTYPTLGSAGPSGIVRSSNVTISATLNERGESVADAQLLLNGTAVDHKTSKNGNAVTVSYSLEAPVGSHDVQLNWNGRSHKWSLKVAALYSQGAAPGSAAGLTGLEYHDIGTTSIPTLQSQDKYPDSPDAQAVAPYFEWPQSGDIAVNPAGNVRDNYGWVMIGYIHPPETGEYVFHVATDDNSELWLSTDESPANAVRIAQESTWQGIRNFQAEGDESVSAPVALEAGKAYFIELVTKEGGGGDNAAVAWRLADDADVGAGALPIAGEHLSQWLVDGDATPPSLSYVINGDGTATVTFEGTLQQAASVNGPWVDVDAASPLTIPLDQDAAFVRAKK